MSEVGVNKSSYGPEDCFWCWYVGESDVPSGHEYFHGRVGPRFRFSWMDVGGYFLSLHVPLMPF